MRMRSRYAVPTGVLLLAVLVSACGGSEAERLLRKSEQIPALHEFGSLFVPLYEEAMADSNWAPVRAQLRELERLKNEVTALDCPENRTLAQREWERNQNLLARGVGFLNVALGAQADSTTRQQQEDIVTGMQGVYDWWVELVRFLR